VSRSPGHLAESGFDRHAGFDADEQQVERVREGPLDRSVATRDLVLHEQHRQVHAEIGGREAHTDLDRGRLIDFEEDEDIEQRADQHDGRHHQPEEQEGDVRRLAAVARLHQQRARLLLAHPLVQVELLDDGLHVLLGGAAQHHLLAAREPLALALAHLLPLERHRLHALGERVGRRSGMASVSTVAIAPMAANTIARKRGSWIFWIRSSIMMRTSEVEIDHLAHDEDADRHPSHAAEQHHAAHRFGP
jgi:hypothetical protein